MSKKTRRFDVRKHKERTYVLRFLLSLAALTLLVIRDRGIGKKWSALSQTIHKFYNIFFVSLRLSYM